MWRTLPPSDGCAEPSTWRDKSAVVNMYPSDGNDAPSEGTNAPVVRLTESSCVHGDAGDGDSCVSWMPKSSGDSSREVVKSFS